MLYHNDWTVFTINSSPLIIWLHSYQVSYIGYTSPVCVCLLHVCVVRLDVNRVWTWAFLTYFSKYSRWRLYFQESKRTNFPIFFFSIFWYEAPGLRVKWSMVIGSPKTLFLFRVAMFTAVQEVRSLTSCPKSCETTWEKAKNSDFLSGHCEASQKLLQLSSKMKRYTLIFMPNTPLDIM